MFFTSDTHFFHGTILFLGNGRPFSTVVEMNDAIVERWNAKVGPSDMVYHLGDFTFGPPSPTAEVVSRLNGQIYFVQGNHDKSMPRIISRVPHKFAAVKDYAEVKYQGKRIVMFHYPIVSWNGAHNGSWHLHGHCHNNLRVKNGPMLDVGVDGHDFAPWAIEEVAEYMRAQPKWEPVDHHDKPLT